MITLTDDEQRTALRAARYCLAGLKAQNAAVLDAGRVAGVAAVERVISVLERKNDNGMWRCLCPNPWRHPDCLVCPVCGAAVPT